MGFDVTAIGTGQIEVETTVRRDRDLPVLAAQRAELREKRTHVDDRRNVQCRPRSYRIILDVNPMDTDERAAWVTSSLTIAMLLALR